MSKVTVFELRKRQDGTVYGVGNSFECTQEKAVELIIKKEAKAEGHRFGEVPKEWQKKTKETVKESKNVTNK